MFNLRDLREQLTDDSIKNILIQFDVEPVFENELYIVFPTCCHNLEGGSAKLYYYKNTKLFKCYTECNCMFDIFELLQKMYVLRGKEISLRQAIALCDLDAGNQLDVSSPDVQDFKYMQSLNGIVSVNIEEMQLKSYDKDILKKYNFSLVGLSPWLEESIGINELTHFQIKYDPLTNSIIIPNFDYRGNLIGVRCRFLNPDSPVKYAPVKYKNDFLSHPTGKSLYGIYENQNNIKRKKMAVIFEGEKSVLKFGTIYGETENIALATLGKNITKEHIQLLLRLGVKQVILAYDADYETYDQLKEKRNEYTKLAQILSTYFITSILLDYDLELNFKDSPIDKGKKIFERLLSERITL